MKNIRELIIDEIDDYVSPHKDLHDLAIRALEELEADGLHCPDGQDPPCACELHDLMLCVESWCNCVPAKKGEDGLLYPMEDESEDNPDWLRAVPADDPGQAGAL